MYILNFFKDYVFLYDAWRKHWTSEYISTGTKIGIFIVSIPFWCAYLFFLMLAMILGGIVAAPMGTVMIPFHCLDRRDGPTHWYEWLDMLLLWLLAVAYCFAMPLARVAWFFGLATAPLYLFMYLIDR